VSGPWPKVPLGEVLKHRKEFIEIDDLADYRRPRVQLHGQGIVLRDVVPGALIKTKKQQVCRAGELLVAEIDAKVGGFGIVPPALDGTIVSSHYFLFEVNESRVVPGFLDYFIRTSAFRDQVEAQGSTNYAAIRPGDVVRYEFPLPPLVEQRRVVARIEELSHEIQRPMTLRHDAVETAKKMMMAEELRIWPPEALKAAPCLESLTLFLSRGRQSEQGDSDHFLIKTQHVQEGRYVPTMLRLAPDAVRRVSAEAKARDGDILVACSAAGCLGRVARYRGDGRNASTDTHIAIVRADPRLVEPEYLYAYLRGAQGQHQLRSRERGDWKREKIGFRLTELNLRDLKGVPVPLPERREQRRTANRLEALRAEVRALECLQAETALQLSALVPAFLNHAFEGRI
jgi:type I restriction enzyme S subunit